jgi:hypothetical protein
VNFRIDMRHPLHPSLYQINTRVWLTELSQSLGRAATLDDIPDAELDHWSAAGFGWIWLLSVWQTGEAGRRVSRANPEWRREFEHTLPDLREDDIAGSGFAIKGYTVSAHLGGDAALARLRERLQARGLRLMLDFVPNHTGLDHPWVAQHPEYYVAGSETDLAQAPANYTRACRAAGDLILAHGRDPYFPGWPDTLQLDYGNPAAQEAMLGELVKIAGQCDGVRCDMAMLILPDVFERTWGRRPKDFWPAATAHVRAQVPGFLFMAEVYWDLEWTLQPYSRLSYACASTSTPDSTTRTSSRAFSRTTTSRARPRPSRGTRTKRRRSSRSCPQAFGSSIRGNSRDGGRGSPLTSAGRRASLSTSRWSASTSGCWRCCASRPFATASGGCSNAPPRGTGTGPGTTSWRSVGRAPIGAGCWSR